MLAGWRMRPRARAFAVLSFISRSVLVALALFFNGCGSRIDKALGRASEQTYEIDPAGSFAIRNSAGSVRVLGSDDAIMKIAIVKKAWDAEQLNGIAARISAETNSVSVET